MDDVQVAAAAVIEDSVIATGAKIGAGARLIGVVIAENATIGAGVELVEGARVWPDAVIGDGAIRFSPDR